MKPLAPPVVLAIALVGCPSPTPSDEEFRRDLVPGFVEKGPFVQGSQVILSELDPDFSQTGRTFVATISSDDGAFAVQGVTLANPVAELAATGFYFNEVSGELSSSPITLSVITDVSSGATFNLNIISSIEKPRIATLLGEGVLFPAARAQASRDVLSSFCLDGQSAALSETLTLQDSGDDGALLLGVSAILQGFRSEAELTQLVSRLSQDIADNGTLDAAELKDALFDGAVLLDPSDVEENLSSRYADIGTPTLAPSIQPVVDAILGCVSTVAVDVDGNVYPSVEIGAQTWLARNLTTTRFANGEAIPNIEADADWAATSEGAWCRFENDATFSRPQGKLYNGFAVQDPRGLCPTGWHIPDDDEWQQLVDFLGGAAVAGGALKATEQSLWEQPNVGATNESRFFGIATPVRDGGGTFNPFFNQSVMWSSTQLSAQVGKIVAIYSSDATVGIGENAGEDIHGGVAVRCVAD